MMTLKDAARKYKIGATALKRALEEGVLKGIKLPGGSWRVGDDSILKLFSEGAVLKSPPKRSKKMEQPEALRRWHESHPGGLRKKQTS